MREFKFRAWDKQSSVMKAWQLTRIGDGWKMCRVENDGIAIRGLTILEHIRHYRLIKSDIQYSKFYHNKQESITEPSSYSCYTNGSEVK